MNDKQRPIDGSGGLGRGAEKRWSEKSLGLVPPQTEAGILRLNHELQVHQIELEMQNEELRRLQEEIEVARTRYFDLYDSAPVGYCTLSEKGLIIEANLAAAKLVGVIRSAFVNQPLARFIFNEDQDIFFLHSHKLFETGEPLVCELRIVLNNGTPIWVNVMATATRDAQGAPAARIALNDINELKRTEGLLRDNLALLQIAGRMARFGGWRVNLADSSVIWSHEVALIHEMPAGYSPTLEEGIGFYAPEWQNTIKSVLNRCSEDGTPFNEEMEIITASGKRLWVQAVGTAIRDKSEKIVGIMGAFQDISDRRHSQIELRKLVRVMEQSPISVMITNAAAQIEYVNAKFTELTGYTLDEVRGRNPRFLSAITQAPGISAELWSTITTGGEWHGVFHNRKKTGVSYWESASISAVRDDANEIQHYVAVKEDITERLRTAEEMKVYRAQLREAQTRLTEIEAIERRRLARELHDQVGTSLTALGLNLHWFRSQVSNTLPSPARAKLDDSMALIEEITRATRSVMNELRSPVLDDYGLIAAAQAYVEQFMTRTGLTVSFAADRLATRPSIAAETALYRILVESLTNVAKHTQATEVSVATRTEGSLFTMTIADNGGGFDVKVRQPGWGLRIMLERAEALGGNLSIQSSPDQGTVISVKVPI
jgi:PAS domain S-box-containing protein